MSRSSLTLWRRYSVELEREGVWSYHRKTTLPNTAIKFQYVLNAFSCLVTVMLGAVMTQRSLYILGIVLQRASQVCGIVTRASSMVMKTERLYRMVRVALFDVWLAEDDRPPLLAGINCVVENFMCLNCSFKCTDSCVVPKTRV
jgi:hypothetical protein